LPPSHPSTKKTPRPLPKRNSKQPPRNPHHTRSKANHATATNDTDATIAFINMPLQSPHAPAIANKAVHPETGESVEYNALLQSSDSPAWEAAAADEIGRLPQGHTRADGTTVAGTETIHFINVSQIPTGRKATYLKIVAADKPNKAIKQRVRFTVGGDRVDYAGDCSTKTADLTTSKCLFNSVVSTPRQNS
jgi:hypothetical protein